MAKIRPTGRVSSRGLYTPKPSGDLHTYSRKKKKHETSNKLTARDIYKLGEKQRKDSTLRKYDKISPSEWAQLFPIVKKRNMALLHNEIVF